MTINKSPSNLSFFPTEYSHQLSPSIHYLRYESNKKTHQKVIDIIVLNGRAYYRESEQLNPSSSNNTWFYFNGTQSKIIRSSQNQQFRFIDGRINTHKTKENPIGFSLFSLGIRDSTNHPVCKRFFDLKSICVSSLLGGGYWESDEGKILKNKLERTYISIFNTTKDMLDKLELNNIVDGIEPKKIKSIGSLNNWLKKRVEDTEQVGMPSNVHASYTSHHDARPDKPNVGCTIM